MADARRSGGVGDRTVNAVKSSPSVLERLYGGIEDNRILTSVRRGMVLAIPEILVGSFALLLLSLPVGGWQTLLDGLWSGSLRLLLTVVRDATLGVISLIMLLTISYSYEEETPAGHRGTLPFVSLCAYLAFTYGPEGFAFAAFESSRLFGAIVVTIASCALFTLLSERFSIRMRSYTDGSDSAFQRSISAIVPACLVIGLFALLGVLLTLLAYLPFLPGILAQVNSVAQFYSVLSSLIPATGLALLINLPLTLWLTPYRTAAEALFYRSILEGRPAAPETEAQS